MSGIGVAERLASDVGLLRYDESGERIVPKDACRDAPLGEDRKCASIPIRDGF